MICIDYDLASKFIRNSNIIKQLNVKEKYIFLKGSPSHLQLIWGSNSRSFWLKSV